MDAPLAILIYEDLIPGTQLRHKLEDLRYRVETVALPGELLATAIKSGPMVIFADLVSKRADICELIQQVRSNETTAHIPVIGFADESESDLRERAKAAGATLVASDVALLPHLVQFIEQALQVD